MTDLIPVALFAWVPIAAGLFALLPARHAMIAAFVGGWLFLPAASHPIQGLPDLTRTTAICLGVVLGMLAFDRSRWKSLRPRWVDLPMITWCLSPFWSALSNDLGAYEGLSASFDRAVHWGAPYFLGRMYFGDLVGLSELAVGLVLGGLAYVPFCIYEIWDGPHLHAAVYGYHQQTLHQAYRFGGWRPAVFMQHGLMVAFWMAATTVVAFWLWLVGGLRLLRGWRGGGVVVVLFGTTLAARSVNAWILLAVGIAALGVVYRFRVAIPLVVLVLVLPLYVTARVGMGWTGTALVPIVSQTFDARRARSVSYRFDIERRGIEKTMQRPLLGWGRGGRAFVYDRHQRKFLPLDSLWMLTLGRSGFLGLVTLLFVLVVPVTVFVWHYPPIRWVDPEVAPATALAMVLVLYAIDNCLNAMVNPLYMLAAGGLCAAAVDKTPASVGESG